jgi:hypothetical protein
MNMADTEKTSADDSRIERLKSIDHVANVEDVSMGFTPQEQKRIKRHVDVRLITTAGILYCVSLIDRTNLGVAVIAGMKEDLKLVGFRYV